LERNEPNPNNEEEQETRFAGAVPGLELDGNKLLQYQFRIKE
jgi:hypothetical protein